MKEDIRDLTIEELGKIVTAMNEPPHRAGQIFKWLFGKGAADFRAMTNLPKSLISKLEEKFYISALKCDERLTSKDGTEKFLWLLKDDAHVESVLIKEKDRATLCLSTQVGCKFGCPFCASGMFGFKRNLDASEIVGQVLAVQALCRLRVTNIVFMGMGEPLDNYDNVVKAIRIINHPDGIGIGARKITISTCGIVPAILKLKDLGLQVELSISLHAAEDHKRDELVPVNRKYPIKELIKACKEYHEKTKRVITLEYTLIKGKNDLVYDAEELAKIARALNAKVNLLSCNIFPDGKGRGVSGKHLELFRKVLKSNGVMVTVRRSRGEDIFAACGQLAARALRAESPG